MDFYKKYKAEITPTTNKFLEEIALAESNLAKAEKRLIDEEQLLQRHINQLEDLKKLSDQSVVIDDNSFEKYKVSLRKVSQQIDSTSLGIQTIKNNVIPENRNAVKLAKDSFRRYLDSFCLHHTGDAINLMIELLDDVVSIRDNYNEAFDKIYKDYGFYFNPMPAIAVSKPYHESFRQIFILPKPKERLASFPG